MYFNLFQTTGKSNLIAHLSYFCLFIAYCFRLYVCSFFIEFYKQFHSLKIVIPGFCANEGNSIL